MRISIQQRTILLIYKHETFAHNTGVINSVRVNKITV